MNRKIFRIASHLFPSRLIISALGQKSILPFYHLVSDHNPEHIKHLYKIKNVKEFESEMDFFLKFFTPLDAKTIVQISSTEIKLKKPGFYISFDDGFREVKDIIAPILLRKGIPATFFVNTAHIGNNDLMYRCKISLIIEKLATSNFTNSKLFEVSKLFDSDGSIESIIRNLLALQYNQVELINQVAVILEVDFITYLKKVQPYLSFNDLVKLSDSGFTIGSHGNNHPYFNQISQEDQINEVKSSIEWVSNYFPGQPKLFAFPFTDEGVSNILINFLTCKPERICDITFGTAGIQKNIHNSHFQRLPMEEKFANGKIIVLGEILYYLAKNTIGYKNNYDKSL